MYEIEKKDLKGAFTVLPIDDVHYGSGALANLEATLAQYGIERALLITGKTLATKTDLVDKVVAASRGRIDKVFHNTTQHVHRASVIDAVEAARSINADGIISFGGGTPNDTGKAVLLALAEDVRNAADFDRYRVKFEYPSKVEVPPVNGDALPMIAISTTLSGGEFTHFAGITDSDRQACRTSCLS
jgi:alcohol dehydrogenase class IV